MKSILKLVCLFTIVSVHIFAGSRSVSAQATQILSVTPPLFQLSILPGDVWQSSVKVVNGNTYPMSVYAEVVNFEPTGESGLGKFTPILENDTDAASLASWIEIPAGPHNIPPEQSADISFFVDVPKNAAPGGHYAAILISTQPPKNESNTYAVLTSQVVTSLFFLRVEGDITELGTIREFRAKKALLQKPDGEFSLRFENKGNVHLQPKGDIIITNMWGAERGRIAVNYQTHFGNVLPNSIRDFNFSWSSSFKIADIGRYTAIATLAYGEDGVKSVSSTAHFWVIPVKATLITFVIIILCISFIVWIVRAYVRRMLLLAGVEPKKQISADNEHVSHTVPEKRKVTVTAPLADGVLDLRHQLKDAHESAEVVTTIWHFIKAYKVFFISVGVLICIFIGTVLYVSHGTKDSSDFTVTVTPEQK